MPITKIADVIVPELFNKYVINNHGAVRVFPERDRGKQPGI